MKKLRNLFAVCLLLLIATTATAQTQSDNAEAKAASAAKADVNGDGVVNEADIEEIIEIMKKDNGVKYYWYAGQDKPTSMTSDPTPDDINYTNNKWHTLDDGINEYVSSSHIGLTITGGTSGSEWYVAVPTTKALKPTATDLKTPDNAWKTDGTILVNNVEYTVWKPGSTGTRRAVYMAQIQ